MYDIRTEGKRVSSTTGPKDCGTVSQGNQLQHGLSWSSTLHLLSTHTPTGWAPGCMRKQYRKLLLPSKPDDPNTPSNKLFP